MLVRKLSPVIAALLVISSIVAEAWQTVAPNLTGTWTGKSFIAKESGPPGEEGLYAVLRQTGTDVTGTVGPSAERQQDISKGKVATTKDGTTLTFDTGRAGHVIHFELKLVDGKLKGPVKDETYPETKLTVELQRAKQVGGPL